MELVVIFHFQQFNLETQNLSKQAPHVRISGSQRCHDVVSALALHPPIAFTLPVVAKLVVVLASVDGGKIRHPAQLAISHTVVECVLKPCLSHLKYALAQLNMSIYLIPEDRKYGLIMKVITVLQ